jgi:hypothetical protein
MGHVVHHTIIATTFDKKLARQLHAYCKELGAAVAVTKSALNGYHTVFVGPDGSKSGWSATDEGDRQRSSIKHLIKSFDYEDGSNPFEWVEVSYSSDDCEAKVVDSQWCAAGAAEAVTFKGTTISVWQERDRFHVRLSRTSDDHTLVEWWDDQVTEAVVDGSLDVSEARLGGLERHVRQGGALHKSAFEYWEAIK